MIKEIGMASLPKRYGFPIMNLRGIKMLEC